MIDLGVNLREQRKKRNLTQAQVSTALGLGDKVLSNYELGYREPDCNTLAKLADFYGVSTDELLKTNKDTEEYKSRVEYLYRDKIEIGLLKLIKDSELWGKYQSNLDEEREIVKNHKNEEEWLEQYYHEKENDVEAFLYDIYMNGDTNDIDLTIRNCEELLAEGHSGIINILLSTIAELYSDMEDCDELTMLELELDLVEKVAIYCAISFSSLSQQIEDIYRICEGSGKYAG